MKLTDLADSLSPQAYADLCESDCSDEEFNAELLRLATTKGEQLMNTPKTDIAHAEFERLAKEHGLEELMSSPDRSLKKFMDTTAKMLTELGPLLEEAQDEQIAAFEEAFTKVKP